MKSKIIAPIVLATTLILSGCVESEDTTEEGVENNEATIEVKSTTIKNAGATIIYEVEINNTTRDTYVSIQPWNDVTHFWDGRGYNFDVKLQCNNGIHPE